MEVFVMGTINPIKLDGIWTEGYALDKHTISSEFLGTDEYGHNQFNTIRSDIGQLLYELKYKANIEKVAEIISLIKPFLLKWGIANKIDIIFPIPSSKKDRAFQPVTEISKEISKVLGKPIYIDVVQNNSTIQSKDLTSAQKTEITGSISINKKFNKKANILLIDDLYETGKTLSETVRALKADPNAMNIYVLTMTKAKNKTWT